MKFYLMSFFILPLFWSYQLMKDHSTQYQMDNLYKVYKIDSINSYYSIYCEKDDQRFKIVSKKGTDNSSKLPKIKVGRFYNFLLQTFPSESNNNPLANSALMVDCYMFEKNTRIRREPGINGLFTTLNLKGLFYNKKP